MFPDKKIFSMYRLQCLTPKQQVMQECELNTLTSDALVVKHQVISSHSGD